jgi:hypothetical protein
MGFPGTRAVLACSSYTLLRDRHMGRFGDDAFRLFGKVVQSQTYGLCFRCHDEDNGIIALRNLDDPDKYRGTEADAGVYIDEPTEMPGTVRGQDILPFLMYPLRASRPVPHMPMMMAFNPDGVGHAWVKGAFITGSKRFNLPAERFHFVQALPFDNPHLDPEWIKTLEGLPEWIRKARLEGSWDMPEGARFPQLSVERHRFKMIDRFPHGIPAHWKRWVSIDWGKRDPYAALWHVLDPAPGGKVYTYRGDYQAGLPSRYQAERVREKTGQYENIDELICDPSMWNAAPDYHMDAGDTRDRAVIDDYIEVLRADTRFGPCVPGPRIPRIVGFNTLDTLLASDRWEIEEGCKALWEELEAAVFNDTVRYGGRVEDIDPRNADHALTCAYYGLHGMTDRLMRLESPQVERHDKGIDKRRKAYFKKLGV